jgi:repressor LexA
MLTQKQRDLLILIHERMSTGEVAPSFEEMKELLGLKSKSGIHRLISGLVERGYLERLPHRARALEVKKLPEGYTPKAEEQNNSKSVFRQDYQPYLHIPLFGKIAAGTPIEAIRHEGQNIEIPPGMISGSGEHYALTVDGESMINAGINDKDIVIIRRADTANNGDIVVALVEGEEVTLKRLIRKDGKIILQPENDEFEPQIYEPEKVSIQGKLVSLYRTYH